MSRLLSLAVAAALALPALAAAQDSTVAPTVPAPAPAMSAPTGVATPKAKHQVLSIQPMSATIGAWAGEFERRVTQQFTVGVGGTHWDWSLFRKDDGEITYSAGDAKLRWYPGGRSLEGFSVGLQGGYTKIKETFSANSGEGNGDGIDVKGPTAGLSVDYSALVGGSRSFYIGVGAGMKTFMFDIEGIDGMSATYPTARFSVGYAF